MCNRLFVLILLLLVTAIQGSQTTVNDSPYSNEPELRGANYMPPQPFILDQDNSDNTGLANWTIIEDEIKVKQVRLVGMSGRSGRKRIDWSTDDKLIVSTVATALSPGRMRRHAVSDFSKFSRGGFVSDHLGVLEIDLNGKNLIIGIGHQSFYFGIWQGTQLQMFESWLLAKQIDDIMKAETGSGLDERVFAKLSGEYNLAKQKQWFEESRNDGDQ